jgi:hypothetical protein
MSNLFCSHKFHKKNDLGSGKRPTPDPDPGVKKAPDPESRILILNIATTFKFVA